MRKELPHDQLVTWQQAPHCGRTLLCTCQDFVTPCQFGVLHYLKPTTAGSVQVYPKMLLESGEEVRHPAFL